MEKLWELRRLDNRRFDSECLDVLYRQSEKIDDLSERMEQNYIGLIERIHKLELQVDGHHKTFSAFKWIATSGGLAGILAFCKDMFPHR